jgi:hypothetical protein
MEGPVPQWPLPPERQNDNYLAVQSVQPLSLLSPEHLREYLIDSTD